MGAFQHTTFAHVGRAERRKWNSELVESYLQQSIFSRIGLHYPILFRGRILFTVVSHHSVAVDCSIRLVSLARPFTYPQGEGKGLVIVLQRFIPFPMNRGEQYFSMYSLWSMVCLHPVELLFRPRVVY